MFIERIADPLPKVCQRMVPTKYAREEDERVCLEEEGKRLVVDLLAGLRECECECVRGHVLTPDGEILGA